MAPTAPIVTVRSRTRENRGRFAWKMERHLPRERERHERRAACVSTVAAPAVAMTTAVPALNGTPSVKNGLSCVPVGGEGDSVLLILT